MFTLRLESSLIYISVDKLTQSVLLVEDRQFLAVFTRWGGSGNSKMGRSSDVYGFVILCELVGWCSFMNRLFGAHPSIVTPRTYK